MDIDNGLDFLPADSEKTFETTDSLLVYDILLDLSSRRGKPWRLLNGDARMIFCVLKKLLLPLRLLGNPLSRKGSVVFFGRGSFFISHVEKLQVDMVRFTGNIIKIIHKHA